MSVNASEERLERVAASELLVSPSGQLRWKQLFFFFSESLLAGISD